MWQTFHCNLPLQLQRISASSVTWRCMVGWVIPDVSKHCSTFQTLGTTHRVTQCHIPEEINLQQHCYENLKPCNSKEICAHANSSQTIWNGASTVPRPQQSEFWDQPVPLRIFLRYFSLLHVWKTKFYVTNTDSTCFVAQAKCRSSTGHSPCKATI